MCPYTRKISGRDRRGEVTHRSGPRDSLGRCYDSLRGGRRTQPVRGQARAVVRARAGETCMGEAGCGPGPGRTRRGTGLQEAQLLVLALVR